MHEALDGTDTAVKAAQTHTYDTPGTYFATARVFANREGDPNAEYRRLQNLASARVVVS